MNHIEALLGELGRASMCPESSSYNGITEKQSSLSYRAKIEKLYSDAVSDLYDIDESRQRIVIRRIDEVRESQVYFDVPSTDTVNALLRDYNEQPEGKRNKSLLDDYRYCRFVLECVDIQKVYLGKFASLVTDNKVPEHAAEIAPDTATIVEKDKEWLSVRETAAKFRLPLNNIKSRQWRIQHDFPFKGFDEQKGAYTKVIFNSEEVENWIKHNRN